MSMTYAVAVGVADVRRTPDPNSELVTQALMNRAVIGDEIVGEWTHVILSDYVGWIRANQLEEPVPRLFCQVGETCRTPLQLFAVVTATHTPLYAAAQGSEDISTVYLSTALPLVNNTEPERVQVALPGDRRGWLDHSAVAIRRADDLYPRASIQVVTSFARAFEKRPYLWGGTSWEGIDCSGFVQLCYRMGGYTIPRDADQQHDFLPCSVERSEIREGDLIFFGEKEITHVALALNNQEYIHAEGVHYNRVVINSFTSSDPHYYPRLDQIVWAVKRVAV